MPFNAPANLAWSLTQRGFVGNDQLLSQVTWRDFKDKSVKLCFKDSAEPALLHMYTCVSPKNMDVSPNGNYHSSHDKPVVDDTVKDIIQNFYGTQPWGHSEYFSKSYTHSIATLTRLQALAGNSLHEQRHLIFKDGAGDKVKFSNKLFIPVSRSIACLLLRPMQTLFLNLSI
jgi:hypothetical protein